MRCIIVLSSALVLASTADNGGLQARKSKRTSPAQEVFSCTTNRIYEVEPAGGDTWEVRTKGQGRDRLVVRLVVDPSDDALILSLKGRTSLSGVYRLRSPKQGSPETSGTGGHADTVVRGESENRLYTIFAGYESGETHASIEIQSFGTHLLTCARGRFREKTVLMRGHPRATIYTLTDAGLAAKFTELPEEPSPNTAAH